MVKKFKKLQGVRELSVWAVMFGPRSAVAQWASETAVPLLRSSERKNYGAESLQCANPISLGEAQLSPQAYRHPTESEHGHK